MIVNKCNKSKCDTQFNGQKLHSNTNKQRTHGKRSPAGNSMTCLEVAAVEVGLHRAFSRAQSMNTRVRRRRFESPCRMAQSAGVLPSRSWRRKSPPASSSRRSMAVLPDRQATCIAVLPSPLRLTMARCQLVSIYYTNSLTGDNLKMIRNIPGNDVLVLWMTELFATVNISVYHPQNVHGSTVSYIWLCVCLSIML